MNKQSIVVLSVPRSGTHAVMKYLQEQGYTEWFAETPTKGIKNIFNCPPQNHFIFGAHLPYEQNKQDLTDSKLKGIYIVRDPRDVAVSLAYFIRDKSLQHKHNSLLVGLKDEEAIQLILDGKDDMDSLETRYEKINGWINHPDVEVIRFEEIIQKTSPPNYDEKYFNNFKTGVIGNWKNFPNIDWTKLNKVIKLNNYKV